MLEYSRYMLYWDITLMLSQKYWLIKFNNSQPVLKWNTQLNQGCLKELFEIAREIHMNHFTWFSCSNCLKIVWTFTWISRGYITLFHVNCMWILHEPKRENHVEPFPVSSREAHLAVYMYMPIFSNVYRQLYIFL